MKTSKKIWAIVLSVLMLVVTLVPSVYTNAADEFTVAGSSAQVKAGEEITVDVNLVNNPGISAINLWYAYDTEYLTLVKEENKISTFTMTNGITTVWDAVSNYTSDGTLSTLTFKVAENAPSGSYEITINFLSASNDSFQAVTAKTTAATITVEALPVAATGVSINKESISLAAGESETLTATVAPDNATNKTVTWTSSDSSVAAVDANGKVEALKKGTATITAKTADGGFTDTCVVTVACAHSKTTTHPAVTSTCKVQGNAEYVTCDDCGAVMSGSNAKLPLASHVLTKHDAIEADHENGGNIDYWTCDVCGKYFSDVAGTQEIAENDTKTDKIPHSYSSEWSKNDTQHWHECGCGNKIDVAEHNYDNACDTECNTCGYTRVTEHDYSSEWSSDGTSHWHECTVCQDKKDVTTHTLEEVVDTKYLKSEASCVSKAVYYKSCSICEGASLETFETGTTNAKKHTGNVEVKDAVKATCTTDGYSGDTYCKDCGEKLEDGKVILAGHDYGTTYKTDAENHWKECGCGNVIEKATHSFGDWKVVKEATTKAAGSKEKVCSVCGYKVSEEIPMLQAETSNTNSPKTGDNGNSIVWIMVAMISCAGVVCVLMRKRKHA